MTTRNDRGRRSRGRLSGALARPRELFGESLPELLLLTGRGGCRRQRPVWR